MGDLATWEMKRLGVLHHFFASFFTGNCSIHFAQLAKDKHRDWEMAESPAVGEDQVQDHQKNLKVPKTMGPGIIQPKVMRKLVKKVAKPLSIIFEKLWQSSEVLND
ncbi:rna-directed dna polymerase from mobile element jockey-like [Pitangus sulphuratus]|nr:rna-directed dna polymerase from mobile element jockey-like [Pitangus sulphuratus]